jgi:hypothetical protein
MEKIKYTGSVESRLFIGIYPCGLVYADRFRVKSGDYARLAFMAYSTLALEVEADCPHELRVKIEEHAQSIKARRGQNFQISTAGQTVVLGSST